MSLQVTTQEARSAEDLAACHGKGGLGAQKASPHLFEALREELLLPGHGQALSETRSRAHGLHSRLA